MILINVGTMNEPECCDVSEAIELEVNQIYSESKQNFTVGYRIDRFLTEKKKNSCRIQTMKKPTSV